LELIAVGLVAALQFGCGPKVTMSVTAPSGAPYSFLNMKVVEHLPQIVLQVGGKEIPLLVDLGGFAGIVLGREIVEDMEVTYTGRLQLSVDARGQPSLSKEFVLPECALGEFRVSGLRGYVAADPPEGARAVVRNGYIGLDLLKQFGLIFDYSNRTLVLIRGDRAPAQYFVGDWPVLRMVPSADGVMTTAQTAGRQLRCIWDTGATFSVIKPSVARDLGHAVEGQAALVQLDEFVLGQRDYGPIEFFPLEFHHPDADCILGYNLFSQHVVGVDFANRQVTVY